MFLRPFHVRSNAAAKGTERKRLCRVVSGLSPGAESSWLDQLLPSRCSLETLRLTSHSGTHVSVSVVNKEPLFYECGGQLFPTVYTLWQAQDLLRSVYTWPPVLEKLQGGADLMLPGVVGRERGGGSLEGVQKGQTCAVALVGNRSAVGVCVSLMSWQEMQACGMRGKGFRILHLYGDKLWELGSQSQPPIHPSDNTPSPSSSSSFSSHATCMTADTATPYQYHKHSLPSSDSHADAESLDIQQGLQLYHPETDLDIPQTEYHPAEQLHHRQAQKLEVEGDGEVTGTSEASGGVEEGGDDWSSGGGGGDGGGQEVGGEGVRDGEEGEGEVGGDEDRVCEKPLVAAEDTLLTTADQLIPEDPIKAMDELLEECFLQALKTKVAKTELPLLTSTLYRTHMLPLCPAHLRMDVKKSSHKKLSRFLAVMSRSCVVKVEETGKGVESITSVDLKHRLIRGFSPSLLVAADSTGDTCSSAAAVATVKSSTAKAVHVTELYMPSHKLMPVFSGCGHNKASLLTAAGVREVVTTYVKTNDLISTQNSRMVVLDPVLSGALYQKAQPLPAQLAWAQLMERVLESMKPAFSVTDGVSQPVIRKGRLQPVQMVVVQRTGNKKVTLVDNLELYGIPAEQLAHTVQRIAAASTTVTSTPGRSGGEQVLVQGNAVKAVARVLQNEYGLPLKFIEAVDKVKPPKKKSGRR